MSNKIKLLGQFEIYENKLVHVFSSVKDAAAYHKTSSSNISQAIKMQCAACKYYWRYFEVDEEKILEVLK